MPGVKSVQRVVCGGCLDFKAGSEISDAKQKFESGCLRFMLLYAFVSLLLKFTSSKISCRFISNLCLFGILNAVSKLASKRTDQQKTDKLFGWKRVAVSNDHL